VLRRRVRRCILAVVMVVVMMMVMLVMVMMIRLVGLLLLLHARAGTADVAAVTGVAALAALDRALSGHPHKCGRVASRARVRRENSRRGVRSKNELKGERKKENDGPRSFKYDGSNSDDALTIALSDTEGEIISLAPSHHCSVVDVGYPRYPSEVSTRAAAGGSTIQEEEL